MKKKYKIFDLDYLQNAELTDDDLRELLDNKNFNISLTVGMFNISNQNLSEEKIINLVMTDKYWMYKYFWTKDQREQFTECLKRAYKNLYRYGDRKIESIVGLWLVQYGLTNCKQKKKKKEYLCE